jgi:UDPglucose 6-dehydrogenase
MPKKANVPDRAEILKEEGLFSIAVVGTGYVGLVTGVCLADFGNQVICVDSDASKIEALRKTRIPFYEFGIEELVRRNMREGRLSFTTDLQEAVRRSQVIMIAVGTPPGADGEADLSAVFDVAGSVGRMMDGYRLVVQKSTAPVGTAARIRESIARQQARPIPFDVASNPEFLREGSAVEDFMRPDRVVIGTWSKRAEQILSDMYRPLYLNDSPIVSTSVETAELIKYASNAFLATKISFINEVANLCEKVGADVKVVARGMGLDKRIGSKFLHAGAGYGGSCFPKDTLALVAFARRAGEPMKIVQAAIEVNDGQWRRVVEKTRAALGGLRGKEIGVLGLSFKPNTDDVRDSVALEIMRALTEAGARVRAFDPVAMENARRVVPKARYCEDVLSAIRGADAVVIATEWNEFRRMNLEQVRKIMKRPVLVDCKNIYDPRDMRELGFQYVGVGRGRTEAQLDAGAASVLKPKPKPEAKAEASSKVSSKVSSEASSRASSKAKSKAVTRADGHGNSGTHLAPAKRAASKRKPKAKSGGRKR